MFASSCTQAPEAGSFLLPDAGHEMPPPDMHADAANDVDPVPEASPAPFDASYPYPLSRCNISQDVYYLDVSGAQGRLALGETTHTDNGTHWFVELQPELEVLLATPSGPVGTIQVWTSNSAPAVPGTYPQGADAGTSLDIVVISETCSVTSGTLNLVDLQYNWSDGSPQGDVTSLLMSFDITCTGQRLRGCVRYSK
jgi:hypothetical protein